MSDCRPKLWLLRCADVKQWTCQQKRDVHKRKNYLDHLTCSGVELDEIRLLDSLTLILWLSLEPSGIKRSVQCWRSDLIWSSALTVWTQGELFAGFERLHPSQRSRSCVSSSPDHTDTEDDGEVREQWTFVLLWQPGRIEDGAASHHAHQCDSSASTCDNWNGDISVRCTVSNQVLLPGLQSCNEPVDTCSTCWHPCDKSGF